MMSTLQELLSRAAREHWTLGHFNFSELDQARAIVEACAEARAPAMLGTSEGERKHFGLHEAVAIRDAFRKDFTIPIFLNADHTKSVEAAKEAIDAGYDSVHIDLSALPFEENIAGTKEIVEYVRARHSNILKNVGMSVEGELGYLRGESKIQQEKIEVKKEDYTDPQQAKEFVERTGIDRLAIAVGNIHGISLDEPALDIERIRAIRAAVPPDVALVLHAGSGIPDEQIRAAIASGIANIHINTDIRVAYIRELKRAFAEDTGEAAMYKLDAGAIVAMKEVIKQKLTLFGAVDQI
ncbi:MAG: class II fructose-bisphosphate aldolase [Candidatus Sungiibacteriota bacterium]